MQNLLSKRYVQFLFILAISSILLIIPCGEQYTIEIKKFSFFSVFAILCVACSIFPLVIPAVLLPIAYFFFGVADMKTVYAPWTSYPLWMMIGAYILGYAMEDCGIMKRIAYSILRIFGSSLNTLLYGLYGTGLVLALITFNGHYVIMAFIAYSICVALGYKHQKESLLILGTGILAGMNLKIFVYRPSTMMMMTEAIQEAVDPSFNMNMFEQMFYALPVLFIGVTYIFFLTKVYKTDNLAFEGGREYFVQKLKELGPMSVQEKKAAVLLTVLMAWILTEPLHKLPSSLPFMVLPWLCFVPGIDIAPESSIKRLDWGIVFFIAVCLSIGGVGTKIGCVNLISNAISPHLENMNAVGFLYIVLLLGTVLNFILTPLALQATLPAPIAALAESLNISPEAPLITIIYSTDMIFLPFEAAIYLIVFGFGLISFREYVKLHTLKCLYYFVMFGLIQIPYWHFFDLIYKS